MTPEYLAGFFDADGSVGAYRDSKGLRLRVQVAGIHRASINLFSEAFGGAVIAQTCRLKHGNRLIWQWTAQGERAKTALVVMLPHLTVKRRQAIEALQFPLHMKHAGGVRGGGSVRRDPMSWDIEAGREVIAHRLVELKAAVA